jgi:hypothetical protein
MQEKTYKKHLTIWIVVTVVLVGVSFYAGGVHAKSAAKNAMTAARGQFAGAGGARTTGANRFGTGGGAVLGSVLSKDDTSMTVKSRDGSSKIVLFSGTTQVLKSAPGAASDISVGTQVSVQGTQNSDGSVSAQSIQIRPDMGGAAAPAPKTAQ